MLNFRSTTAITWCLVALTSTSRAFASPGVPAVVLPTFFTSPSELNPRHKGGDTVSLYNNLWARLAWATSTGFVVSQDGINCGLRTWTFSDDFVMDKKTNDVCESNGQYNPGPTTGPWCGGSFVLLQSPGPTVLGLVGPELIYRKCNGLAYRWTAPWSEVAVPNAESDWWEFRTDEGTHVLEYGNYGQPLGLRVVNSTGSGITLGQVLYPPNGTWTVSDYSLKADSITVRITNAISGERRCDYYTKSGATWALVRSMTSTQFGGTIVGIGDRRAAVWNAATPEMVAVFRVDYAPPFIETVFNLAVTPDGTGHSSVPFAYVRRGSLLCQASWASDSKTRLLVGNRSEQSMPWPGDLNADRVIDGADLGILLDQWGIATTFSVADINRDGLVDGADLGTLLTRWGPCPN